MSKMPAHIPPMLAVLAKMPARCDKYSFEFKWDGVRAVCYYDGRGLCFESRNLLNMTPRYPELLPLKKALRKPVILDGEIVALDRKGRPDFGLLQTRMHAAKASRRISSFPIQYIIFDILYHNGQNLMPLAFQERRGELEKLNLEHENWKTSPCTFGNGKAVWDLASQHELEGVIAKTLDSPYEPGVRSPSWLKIKRVLKEEFLIGGWTPGKGGIAEGVGALLLGYYDQDERLHYAGKVGSGISDEERRILRGWFTKNPLDENPFEEPVDDRAAVFCKPQWIAAIEFRGWTPGRRIRQGSYQGLRDDKAPHEVVHEAGVS
jgi:bifunctional non-homologous end joining protein LigD